MNSFGNVIKIVDDKKKLTMKTYNTVMINTCYELGIGINRDILYDIIIKRYGLSTIYESDGYPGVRIQYFYNENNIGTEHEGKCYDYDMSETMHRQTEATERDESET